MVPSPPSGDPMRIRVLSALLLATIAWCGDYALAPDSPGRILIPAESGGSRAYYGLSAADHAAYGQTLRRMLDILLGTPHFNPPTGFTANVALRPWESSLCASQPCLKIPVAGQGSIVFRHHVVSEGRVVPVNESPYYIDFRINDLVDALGKPVHDFIDEQGRRIRYQPRPVGELGGFPVYDPDGGGAHVMILARRGRSWWKPISQEAFLHSAIRNLEKDVAALPPQSDSPAADLYQKWLEDRPRRQAEARKTYEAMKKQNPALAETLRQGSEKMEADMTEGFRKDADLQKVRRAQAGPRPKGPTLQDRLARHRAVLAAMTPEMRARQAWYFDVKDPLDPPLGSPEQGLPLAVEDSTYFDPALPRTAIQMITVRYGSYLSGPLKPGEDGQMNPGYRAEWQTLHGTPWAKLKEIMAK